MPRIPDFNLDNFTIGRRLTIGCLVNTCVTDVTVTLLKGRDLVLMAMQDETDTSVYNVNLEVDESTLGVYACKVDIPGFSTLQKFSITGT